MRSNIRYWTKYNRCFRRKIYSGLSKKKITNDTEETNTTESEFDTPQWSREQYQQCYANINVGHSVGRTYWAKSDNGQFCESCTGGKCLYNRNKNPNTCKQSPFSAMSNGEWKIKLKNGKAISGISMCSTTRGSNKKDGEYDLQNDINTNGTGFNCWCKITKTDLTECIKTQQFPWVFVEEFWQISDNDLQNDDNPTLPAKYFTRGANSCSWSCAQECGYKFFDYNSYIILQSHGVEYIQDYYTKK